MNLMNLLNLNPNQQEAVNWGEGPLMVLAGPGSGKTTVLTQRIIRILNESIGERFRILALTFTKNAAKNMREKIDAAVSHGRERVYLTHFHSFCVDVIRQHGELEGIDTTFSILTIDEDRQELLLEIISEAIEKGLNFRKEDIRYLSVINSALERCVIQEEEPTPNSDEAKAAYLYYHYVKKMKTTARIDYAGLLYFAWILLGRKQVFKHYSIVYKYICVDEYQDTNLVQYKLLTRLLSEESPNIFVVADDDQIIYQWNGASPDRLNEIITKYKMQVLQLPENYRCPTEVVNIANKMIANNTFRYPSKILGISLSEENSNNSVQVFSFDTFSEEIEWITQDIMIKERTNKDTKIMARTRKLLENAQSRLNELGVKSIIYQRKIEFESPSMRFLHSLLRLFSSRADRIRLQRLLAAFYQIEGVNIDYHSVIGQTSFTNGDLLKAFIKTVLEHDRIVNKTISFIHKIDNDSYYIEYNLFAKLIFNWLDTFENDDSLSEESYNNYLSEKRIFNDLKDEIEKEVTDKLSLSTFLQELDSRDKSDQVPEDAFELITIHAAKGLEFENVYLIGMADDLLPSYNSIKNGARPENLEEERRSCYVAITRTLKTLTMTYSNKYYGWSKNPSRFMYEMGLLGN
jgi:DNA helicase-2/ATP-dependent DNA helicase PcrA